MGFGPRRNTSLRHFLLQSARGARQPCRGWIPLEHSQATEVALGILRGILRSHCACFSVCAQSRLRPSFRLQAGDSTASPNTSVDRRIDDAGRQCDRLRNFLLRESGGNEVTADSGKNGRLA
jgi:hypothetical protein